MAYPHPNSASDPTLLPCISQFQLQACIHTHDTHTCTIIITIKSSPQQSSDQAGIHSTYTPIHKTNRNVCTQNKSVHAHVDTAQKHPQKQSFCWHYVEASGFWFTVAYLCESQQWLVNTSHQPVLLMLACLLSLLTYATTPTDFCRYRGNNTFRATQGKTLFITKWNEALTNRIVSFLVVEIHQNSS